MLKSKRFGGTAPNLDAAGSSSQTATERSGDGGRPGAAGGEGEQDMEPSTGDKGKEVQR